MVLSLLFPSLNQLGSKFTSTTHLSTEKSSLLHIFPIYTLTHLQFINFALSFIVPFIFLNQSLYSQFWGFFRWKYSWPLNNIRVRPPAPCTLRSRPLHYFWPPKKWSPSFSTTTFGPLEAYCSPEALPISWTFYEHIFCMSGVLCLEKRACFKGNIYSAVLHALAPSTCRLFIVVGYTRCKLMCE